MHEPQEQATAEALRKADPYGERLKVLLAKGHYEAAKRMTDLAIQEMSEPKSRYKEMNLNELLCERTCNLLAKHRDCLSLPDLRELTIQEISEIPNVGWCTVNEIWEKVLDLLFSEEDEYGQF